MSVSLVAGMSMTVLLVLILIITGIRRVHPGQCGVLFICGCLKGRRGPGNYWVPPLIARMVNIDLHPVALQLFAQAVTARDLATIQIDVTCSYSVVDPVAAVLSVSNLHQTIREASLATLCRMYGQYDLEEVVAYHDSIERDVQALLTIHTHRWGVKVVKIEVTHLNGQSVLYSIDTEAEHSSMR